MALKQFGEQGYKYGFTDADAAAIAAVVGLAPQELTFGTEPEVEAEGKDEFGRTVAYVIDTAGKKNFQLSGYVSNAGLFALAVAKTFVYEGHVFIIRNKELTVKKDDFQMGSMTGVSFPLVTDEVGTQIAA